ncbi:MAG: hypothetical protein LBC03_01345 [Nitrososphaerota archaeon]|nr:hypothetical protein [Nitrososphaerota archaeon]
MESLEENKYPCGNGSIEELFERPVLDGFILAFCVRVIELQWPPKQTNITQKHNINNLKATFIGHS